MHNQRVFNKYLMNGEKGADASLINDERIAQLNLIGFEWLLYSGTTWQDKYQLLHAFKLENGHCRVPFQFVVDSVYLGCWVHDQRQVYNYWMSCSQRDSASIINERIAQLNLIGFDWDSDEEAEEWQRQFEHLYAFQRQYGHCNVPQNSGSNSVKLSDWMNDQRQHYNNFMERRYGGSGVFISAKHMAQLIAIGFEWNTDMPPDHLNQAQDLSQEILGWLLSPLCLPCTQESPDCVSVTKVSV